MPEGHWHSVRQALVAAAAETVKAGRGTTAAATGGPSPRLLSGGVAAAVSLIAAAGRRTRFLCTAGSSENDPTPSLPTSAAAPPTSVPAVEHTPSAHPPDRPSTLDAAKVHCLHVASLWLCFMFC